MLHMRKQKEESDMRNLLSIGAVALTLSLVSTGARADNTNAGYFLLGAIAGSQLHGDHGVRRAPARWQSYRAHSYQRTRSLNARRCHLQGHGVHRSHSYLQHGNAGYHGLTHRDHRQSHRQSHHMSRDRSRAHRDYREDHWKDKKHRERRSYR